MPKQQRNTSGQGRVQNVTTVSTFPPPGTFTKTGEEIARVMALKSVSPGGIASGLRMVVYFKNRAGRKLSPERRRELDKAIRILQSKLAQGKKKPSSEKVDMRRRKSES
jgi:tRNA(adenine34) deaminase